PIAAVPDIRLPIPGAVWIFRCGRPVAGRARRDRRQGGRDQFFKPAIRGQRPLECLLKSRDLVGRENETEIRSEVIDLLESRKPNYHASPASCLGRKTIGRLNYWHTLGRKTKKATRGPERPRMASTPYLSMVA